jgi:DNA mismatch endonuclease, patch repair protein
LLWRDSKKDGIDACILFSVSFHLAYSLGKIIRSSNNDRYVDHLTKQKRSKLMAKVRRENTAPEMLVREVIWAEGFRYRLHVKKLPGCPDIVLTRLKKAIFVNGCFWHGHFCRRKQMPKTNAQFWLLKIERNKKRDSSNIRKLKRRGWSCLVVWECHLKDLTTTDRILEFLKS